ncbi:YybH family protein [Novosphingobium aquiterrae]|uniref:YybH family protein n=1 Tax=Novosphingobium aquiterrae TaxID=624388 RepID=A0ABV6PHN6_9SPHN
MKEVALLLAAASLALGSPANAKPAPPQLAQIVSSMQASASGWNSGDLDKFMAVYSPSTETTFVSGNGLIRGKQAIADHYLKDFGFADSAKRGTLTFETLNYRPLGNRMALYIARYTLTYLDGKSASGVTSVLFRRDKGAWHIVADHSS